MFSQGEQFSSSQIISFQGQKLGDQLLYLQRNSPFYRRMFNENGIDISSIHTITDLQNLPTTEKEHLQADTFSFLCVPKNKIVSYVSTSGTLGTPIDFALTENDLQRLAHNEYLSFINAGLTREDIILLTVTGDRCFMAGNAYVLGARKLGAALIHTGPGVPELQWATILRLQPTVIIAVPSFLLKLIDFAEKNGIDFRNTKVAKAICVGESLRMEDLSPNLLAQKITEKWPIELYSTYASTEMSTSFTECAHRRGGHAHAELILVECLDENDQPVAPGSLGEITVTTLGVEGMPLLRFKTGDMAQVHYDPCPCGNPSLRIGPILGRKKQMIKYKGTTFYPNAVKQTLLSLPFVEEFYTEWWTSDLGTDELTVHISMGNYSLEKEKHIKDAFKAHLRVVPNLVFELKSEIQSVKYNANSRKPIEFIDKRKG